MGQIKISYSTQFSDDIADLIYFIESKGMLSTAKNYVEKVYAFIECLDFKKVNYATCKDRLRAYDGLKCVSYKRKYTIVFYQFENEVIITEFIAQKLIK
jgi:hypothetical protein